MSVPIESPWTLRHSDVVRTLQTESKDGLTRAEWGRRLRLYGPNALKRRPPRTAGGILLAQFKSPLVLLLFSAGMAALLLGETTDAAAIFSVLALNGLIGFVTELRATRSMEALLRLGVQQCTVVREGNQGRVPANELVPGDILILDAGDGVSADARIIEASSLLANESILTGEAFPVEKIEDPLPLETPIHMRKNMLFRGCTIVQGSARAVVVATGLATELGTISSLVAQAPDEETPLELRLEKLGMALVWATVGTAGLVAVSGFFNHKEPFLILETAIALAVSAIPEGLPIVATMALARGMWRMSRRRALVRRLAAVETLGSTSVILTDKTGTLTQNRLKVTEVQSLDDNRNALFRVAVLCSNASVVDAERVGDPLEVALLEAAAVDGHTREDLLETFPEVEEFAFKTQSRRMATIHKHPEAGFLVTAKGAPEAIIELCPDIDQDHWLDSARKMASRGLKVLALADKVCSTATDDPFQALSLRGLVGLSDPPREGIDRALESCREAGIRVIMATGDQAETALAIAQSVKLSEKNLVVEGTEIDSLPAETLLESDIFARVTPKQKMQLIELYQKAGAVIAMTGDGVNDAPALKASNIGIAMGERGSQVAEEAADLILEDDRFDTIVAAVEEGRVIFDNIRAFALYLLSCNLSELLAVGIAALLAIPLPVLPLQILFLNMVTDIFPALALGVSGPTAGVMQRPPKAPNEPILKKEHWQSIGFYAVVVAASVLGVLLYALTTMKLPEKEAVTLSFLTLGFAQTFHVFNARAREAGILESAVARNRFVWLALVLCTLTLLLATYWGPLSRLLTLVPPTPTGWIVVTLGAIFPVVVGWVARLRFRV